MNATRNYSCTICGEEASAPSRWFLVTESHWEDKLRILEWNDRLAVQEGIHRACSPAHVQELVVHWMATGSIDHPFARMASWNVPARRWSDNSSLRLNVDTQGAQPIGELSVHRESMRRLLTENPDSLKSVLDALDGALQRDVKSEASTGLPEAS